MTSTTVEDEELARTLQAIADEEDGEYDVVVEEHEVKEGGGGLDVRQQIAAADIEALDADFMIALKLQWEYDSEQLARHIQEKYRQSKDGSKVCAVYDLSPQKDFRPNVIFSDDEGDEDEEEEEEEYGEYQKSSEEIGKLYHQVSKVGGRMPKKEASPSRHDLGSTGHKNAERVERLMDSGNLGGVGLSAPVYNSLVKTARKQQGHENRIRTNKTVRATNESVLDPKTRLILLKMINANLLSHVNGIVSTGKEANVYHAMPGTEDTREYAIKVYKTVLNEFKDRTKYIEGDFRFRHHTNKTSKMNTSKLIKLWAEKETRNLKKLQQVGIPCPTPIALKRNVLVMTFLGKDGFPAPRLKDADLTEEQCRACYLQLVKIMRDFYQKAHLVHADLSEFNILFHKSKLWIIDVSQSVEYNHPHSLGFLRKDCAAVTSFFEKKMGNCLSVRQLFDFITDVNLEEKDVDRYLTKMQEINATAGEKSNEDKIKDQVFQHAFIPRDLREVKDPHLEDGDVYHQAVTGMRPSILEDEK